MKKTLMKIIGRTYSNHLIIIVLSFTFMPLTSMLANKFKLPDISIYSSALCIVIFALFIYQILWKLGWDDIGRVKREAEKYYFFKGFLGIVIAFIPLAVITTLYTMFYVPGNAEANALMPLLDMLYKIINLPFLGIFRIFPNAYMKPLVYLIIAFVGGIAYVLGYKNIMIHKKIMYSSKNKE